MGDELLVDFFLFDLMVIYYESFFENGRMMIYCEFFIDKILSFCFFIVKGIFDYVVFFVRDFSGFFIW